MFECLRRTAVRYVVIAMAASAILPLDSPPEQVVHLERAGIEKGLNFWHISSCNSGSKFESRPVRRSRHKLYDPYTEFRLERIWSIRILYCKYQKQRAFIKILMLKRTASRKLKQLRSQMLVVCYIIGAWISWYGPSGLCLLHPSSALCPYVLWWSLSSDWLSRSTSLGTQNHRIYRLKSFMYHRV